MGDAGQTADIGIDTRRNRVVVPRLDNDTVEIHQVGNPGARDAVQHRMPMLLLLASLFVTPQAPAAPVLTHDASFEVQGAVYTGAARFAVDAKGAVTGVLKLDSPAVVDAKLGGQVKDGVWTFSYPFTMDNQGQACSGTVSGTAKVTGNGAETSGPVTIAGDCSPEPLTGTFKFVARKK